MLRFVPELRGIGLSEYEGFRSLDGGGFLVLARCGGSVALSWGFADYNSIRPHMRSSLN